MSHALARPKIRRGSALVAAAIAAALTLAGCSTTGEGADSASSSTSADGVVIEHGHGKTVIPEKPQRIVTLGWMSADIVAALTSTSAMDSFLKTAEGDNWYTGVSLENLYDVEADLFAAWGGSADEGAYTVENKVMSRWNPIANGSYVIYGDAAEASAISAPTVLSLKYILPKYDDLAAALQGEPTITGR